MKIFKKFTYYAIFMAIDLQITASIEKKACVCGPVEHVFTKKAIAFYAKNNPNSGLEINHETEGVSTHVVDALSLLAQDFNFSDEQGNLIQAQPFKDTSKMVLPLFKSPEYMLVRSVIAQTSMKSKLPATKLYNDWSEKYTWLQGLQHDRVVVCHPCKK